MSEITLLGDCNCKLCCVGELPGKESHIFSNFLIRETIYKDGRATVDKNLGRDHDLMFVLKPFQTINMFFKGSSTAEALDYLGKEEFSDEEVDELRKQSNPLTDFMLVCVSCEESFNSIESTFQKIYLNIIKSSVEHNYYELNDNESKIVEIFLLMNIWRASASEKIVWKLSDISIHGLTYILYNTFYKTKGKLNVIVENFSKIILSSNIKHIYNSFKIITFLNRNVIDQDNNSNTNFITCYYSTRPYCILINRLCLIFSEVNFNDVGNPKILGDSISLVDKIADSKRRIYILTNGELNEISKNVAGEQIDLTKDLIRDIYVAGYRKYCRTQPSPQSIVNLFPYVLDSVMEGYKHGSFGKRVIVKIIEYIQMECVKNSQFNFLVDT